MTGIARSAPNILFFREIPTDERIAEIRRENSKMPEQRKEITIGSFRLDTRMLEVLVRESKTKELLAPKTDNNTLEKKPKK
ncbi:MAG TPA: hypothetical protein PLK55_03580 [archaeon]|jgi:hypothetical protein|nr:hypothetical protein [archaeon]